MQLKRRDGNEEEGLELKKNSPRIIRERNKIKAQVNVHRIVYYSFPMNCLTDTPPVSHRQGSVLLFVV